MIGVAESGCQEGVVWVVDGFLDAALDQDADDFTLLDVA